MYYGDKCIHWGGNLSLLKGGLHDFLGDFGFWDKKYYLINYTNFNMRRILDLILKF